MAEINRDNVPDAMQEKDKWVVWHEEERDDDTAKIPYGPETDKPASSTDPDTWPTFKRALGAYQHGGQWDGIGFVFSTDDLIAGVDLDHYLSFPFSSGYCARPEISRWRTYVGFDEIRAEIGNRHAARTSPGRRRVTAPRRASADPRRARRILG